MDFVRYIIRWAHKVRGQIKKALGSWKVQWTMIAGTLLIGLICYGIYFTWKDAESSLTSPLLQAIYSTIRLFTASLDASRKDFNGPLWIFPLLEIARWIALFLTGTALFRLLNPILIHFRSNAHYFIWRKMNHRLLLVGANSENQAFFDREGLSTVICTTDKEALMKLSSEGYDYIDREEAVIESVVDAFRHHEVSCTIVINTHDEEKNLSLSSAVVAKIREFFLPAKTMLDELENQLKSSPAKSAENELLKKKILQLKGDMVQKLQRINVVVFGDAAFESVYLHMEEESFGTLHYTNKYRSVAIDFVDRYPLTGFIDRKKYISSLGLLDQHYDVNVIFVGFGETSQEIFATSMAIDQFITDGNGENSEENDADAARFDLPCTNPVHYHIYDKEEAQNNKKLNHSFFRYKDEFMPEIESDIRNREDYFPLPDYPADVIFHKRDVEEPGFYRSIHDVCCRNEKASNILIVSVGSDIDNIDLGKKLHEKLGEWGRRGNCWVFVKVRNEKNDSIITLMKDSHLISFGHERQIAFNLQNVLRNDLVEMSRKKHFWNDLVKNMHKRGTEIGVSEQELEIQSLYEWHIFEPRKKKSSIYAILAMRSKLQLMGLDYRRSGTGSSENVLHSNEAYFSIYAKDDIPEVDYVIEEEGRVEIYRYNRLMEIKDFQHQTLRKNLAIQEHHRWNAFEISDGMVPGTKQNVMDGIYHDYNVSRTHTNITTESGLVEFRKLKAGRNGSSEEKADVINYDFHIMDEAWWYLNRFGYEIYVKDDPDQNTMVSSAM